MNLRVFSPIRRYKKAIACTFLCVFSCDIYASTMLMVNYNRKDDSVLNAVVPPQEMGSFSAVEPGDWVNKFTGDFNYSIPLFEIGGYPINMTYNSNIALESEASWVGLGWNLNPGNISRNMRGLPDDFQSKSDFVVQSDRMRRNDRLTLGLAGNLSEFIGLPTKKLKVNPSLNFELFYDNYSGFGYGFGAGLSLPVAKTFFVIPLSTSVQLGLQFGSDNGLATSGGLTLSSSSTDQLTKTTTTSSATVGTSYNARQGFGDVTVNLKQTITQINQNGEVNQRQSNSGGARFTVGNRTYLPSTTVPISSFSFGANFKFGVEFKFIKKGLALSGQYSVQRLAGTNLLAAAPLLTRRLKAFGYLNYVDSRDYNQTNAVYDVNTENETNLSDDTPAFNLAFATYDMFQVSAQGVSGAYRAHKASPITVISDGYVDANGGNQRVDLEGGNLGGELTALDLTAIGVNGGIQIGDEHNSGWDASDMPSLGKLGTAPPEKNSYYRPAYFKQVGMLTPLNTSVYNSTLAEVPFKFPLDRGLLLGSTATPWRNYADISNRIKVVSEFKSKKLQGTDLSITKSVQNSYKTRNRVANPQAFTYYTAKEAKTLENGSNDLRYRNSSNASLSFERVNGKRKSNHISRIDIARNDGYQYHFGLPVYSLKQKEASFNVSNGTAQNTILSDNGMDVINTELCKYETGIDGLPKGKGITEYYNAREYSPYATSFLLTEVLSPDYYDIGGNGPSVDDLGDYVKFTYKSWFDEYKPFKWKSPAAHFESRNSNDVGKRHLFANYDEGRASLNEKENGDATGFYTYGEKEVWYVDTIRSKEKIAIFHTSKSESPFDESLSGENGGYVSTQSLAKLDSIQIFTVGDFNSTGIPEQTIHFRYSYELCKLNGQASSGKLTLERMFRTFRDSKKSAYTGYAFEYNFNPDYRSFLRDPWGNYQGLTNGISAPNYASNIEDRPENNIESPFTQQLSKAQADLNAAAWRLSGIEIPSGGRLDIEYESDSYAYVQNKRAGKVFPIAGFSNTPTGTIRNFLYNAGTNTSNNYVFVDISQFAGVFSGSGLSNQQSLELFWKRALQGMHSIPIRCLVDITNDNDYEYVKLNAKFDSTAQGIVGGGGQPFYGYVKLNEQKFSRNRRKSIQAVAKHSLQIAREDFFQKIFSGELNPDGLEKILSSLYGFANDAKAMIKGQENVLLEKRFGSRVRLSKSMIVLQDPAQNKFGGGCRVKKIEMNDKWNDMTPSNHKSGISGWEYSYTTTDTIPSIGGDIYQTISSGVAEWEPNLCSFENLNLESIESVDPRLAAPSNSFYQTTPYGMSIFPNASVGYSHVSVTMIRPSNQSGNPVVPIGKTLCEYHTAKDFPVITDRTLPDFEKFPKNKLDEINLLGTGATSMGIASQGFTIVMNDMHGKQKREEHFKASQKSAFRTVEYDYQPLNSFSTQNSKENEVSLLSSSGSVYKNQVGIEHDITVYTKEHYSISRSFQINPGVDVSIIFIPIPIPSFLTPPNSQAILGRLITATKVVYKYGILQNVTTTEDGAKTEGRNLVYDEVTGQPILTQNINEFQDSVYSFMYPAHWMYKRFKSRVERDGIELSNLSWDATGTITGGDRINGERVVVDGDVLIDNDFSRAYQVYEKSTGQLGLAFKWGVNHGNPVNFPKQNANVRIIAEGNENKLTQNAGQILSLANPIVNNQLQINAATEVLDSKSMTFKQFALEEAPCYCSADALNNPIVMQLAKSHRWYPETEYLVKRDRRYTQKAGHRFNLRHDGIYESFTPFWTNSSANWQSNPIGWTFIQANTMVNTFGKPEEFMDPFNRFTTVKWGHNQTLKRAEIFNVRRNEGLVEDFEFNTSENCLDGVKYPGDVGQTEGHTGINSLHVPPGQEVLIEGKSNN